jgi:hypothetical protein
MAKELGEVADESESLRASFSTEQSNEESFELENEHSSSLKVRSIYFSNSFALCSLGFHVATHFLFCDCRKTF